MVKDARQQLESLFCGIASTRATDNTLNGVDVANKAVEKANEDGSSLIFLTRSEYQDLIFRACLPELKSYKKKQIIIVSDND